MMLEQLLELDKDLFLFLNGLHTDTLDPIMIGLTKSRYWLPLFAIVVFGIVRKFKEKSLWIFVGVALTVLFADQFTSSFMKPFFERWRPSRDPEIGTLVHTVGGYLGGKFGFASSHAANSFGVSLFLLLTARAKVAWVWIMFIWAVVFSYTRIYLGVHYPGDIIVGASVGMFGAWLLAIAHKRFSHILPLQ